MGGGEKVTTYKFFLLEKNLLHGHGKGDVDPRGFKWTPIVRSPHVVPSNNETRLENTRPPSAK